MRDYVESDKSLVQKAKEAVEFLNTQLQNATTNEQYNYILANIEKFNTSISRLLKEGKLSINDALSLSKSFNDIKFKVELKVNGITNIDNQLSSVTYYKNALTAIYQQAKETDDIDELTEFMNKTISLSNQFGNDKTLSTDKKDELYDLSFQIKEWLDKRIDALTRYHNIHF